MSDHQAERIPSSCAEVTVVKCNLNVGIFGDEFDVFIKHPENASNNAFDSFVDWVFFVTDLFILIDDVFKNNSNECD